MVVKNQMYAVPLQFFLPKKRLRAVARSPFLVCLRPNLKPVRSEDLRFSSRLRKLPSNVLELSAAEVTNLLMDVEVLWLFFAPVGKPLPSFKR